MPSAIQEIGVICVACVYAGSASAPGTGRGKFRLGTGRIASRYNRAMRAALGLCCGIVADNATELARALQ